jgi:hypothetical protein
MRYKIVPSTVLTTDHPASSHGVPVVVVGTEAYGPMDTIGGRQAAKIVTAWGCKPDRTPDEQDAARAFLRQWPAGPQLPDGDGLNPTDMRETIS